MLDAWVLVRVATAGKCLIAVKPGKCLLALPLILHTETITTGHSSTVH